MHRVAITDTKAGRKVLGIADRRESASNRPKNALQEHQARIKEKIIIITLQGTILNEEQEIPNTSTFLNMMKKKTDLTFVYIGGIDAKQMKEIKKLFRAYAFPTGKILLKNKNMDVDQHFSSNLKELKEKYDIQVLITSNEIVFLKSKLLGIPIVKTPKNTEWNHKKRQEIMLISRSPNF